MSLEIKIGPPQLAIHQGNTVFWSELDGKITWPSNKGLYEISLRCDSLAVYANGRVTLDVELAPGGTWHSCLAYDLSNGEQRFARKGDPACVVRRDLKSGLSSHR